jgi:hypothetical protein
LKPWETRYIAPSVQLDGIWLGGTEIALGTYQLLPHATGNTYWETDADVNGGTIIDNDLTTGQTYMPVDASAKAVVILGVWTV